MAAVDRLDSGGLTNGSVANGVANDHLVDEEEESRASLRPVDVDADMREMCRRKRVEAILTSKTFRAELDRLIENGSLESAPGHIQQAIDMIGGLRIGLTGHATPASGGLQCVQPIADLRGPAVPHMSKTEKMMRCKLASLMRLFDLHDWCQVMTCAHITVRISQDLEHFLVNPIGVPYTESSASSLVKVDMQGGLVLPTGSQSTADSQQQQEEQENPAENQLQFLHNSFSQLHAPIHAARPDLRCIAHVQHRAVLAVSSLRRPGLMALTEHTARLGPVSWQEPQPQQQQQAPLERLLGVHNKVLILANRGALCCGESVEEVYYLSTQLIAACQTQIRLMPLGVDNLLLMSEEQQRSVYEEARRGVPVAPGASGAPVWRLGEMQFEAAMRELDNAGYRTGHLYRHTGRGEPILHQSDVEYPPSASSHTYDTDDVFKYSPMRRMFAGLRPHDRGRWLNSPNAYQKVEILEAGTNDPKKITKWVSDDTAANAGTPVKVDSLQFVPKNTNPKEFKQLQQQIKENRRAGGVSAGPQSHILEGVRWDDVRQSGDATDSAQSACDQVVLVGAASKGIIQRDYQHHATMYKLPYAKNPFDQVTEEDLDQYKREIEMKGRAQSSERGEVSASAAGAAEHAEHVQLASDGEEVPADISRDSAHGDATLTTNGDDTDIGHLSTLSQTDQEDLSTSEASKKDKKKKKGLRTPSFLKKKKDKKREKKEMLDASK